MIIVALVARGALDDKKEADTEPVAVVCVPELARLCEVLATVSDEKLVATVEAPAATVARLTKIAETGPTPVDLWLTAAPWPSVLESARTREGRSPLFRANPSLLAQSPLVLVAFADRAKVMRDHCGGKLSWKCVGDAANAPGGWAAIGGRDTWGRVKVGTGALNQDATSVAVLGEATRSYFAKTSLSRDDLDLNDRYGDWLTGLVRNIERANVDTGSALERMLTFGSSTLEVVGTTDADAKTAGVANLPEFTVASSEPPAVVEIRALVAEGAEQRRAEALAARAVVAETLRELGWRTVSGAPPFAKTNLPSDGLLEALFVRWKAIVKVS